MLKKFSYLIVCIVFMFSFYDNVFGDVCPNYSCPTGNGIDNGDTPVILYENKRSNTIQPSGTCSANSIAGDNTPLATENIYLDKDDGNQYNPCKYECYKQHKIMVLIDHSNSMGKENKVALARRMLGKIAKAAGDNDLIKVCYFGGCLTNIKGANSSGWFNPKNANSVEDAKSKLGVGKENTDFVAAFQRAEKVFDGVENYIPVLFFLTDGYPTQIDSDDDSEDRALGYMSSARYAYRSVKALVDLSNFLKNRNYKNPYAKANAKIITVGIGFDGSDPFARYILQPNSTNYNGLVSGSSNNESRKLRSLLDGNYTQAEVVANVCSFPDKGGVVSGNVTVNDLEHKDENCISTKMETRYRNVQKKDQQFCTNQNDVLKNITDWTKERKNEKCKAGTRYWTYKTVQEAYQVEVCDKYKQRHRINFTNLPFNFTAIDDKQIIKDNGICFYGVDNPNNVEFKMKENGKVVTLTEGEDYNKDKYNGNKYNGTYRYVLNGNFYLSHPNAEYRLVWEGNSTDLNARLTTYTVGGNLAKYNNGVVYASYLGSDIDAFASTIGRYSVVTEDIDESLFNKTTRYTKSINNSVDKNVSLSLSGDYYIRENGIYKRVGLYVPVLIKENMSFSAGDNLKAGITVDAGRGFSIGANATVKSTISWYYRYFANVSGSGNNITPSNPIVWANGKKYTTNDIYTDTRGTNLSNLDLLVWNNIKNSYISDASSSIVDYYKTVDSNDVDDSNFTMPLSVDRENRCTGMVYNANLGSGNNCTITYKISQPIGCYDDIDDEFVYGSDCDQNNDSYNIERPNQYFIPFDHEIGDRYVNINGVYGSVQGVSFNINNSCKLTVGNGTIMKYPDKLTYRTIDVEDPFPKSNNELSKIAVNWREWYCSNSDNSSGNCAIDNQNKMRLANSYNSSRLLYSVNLNDSVIDDIVSDTNSGNYYYSFGSLEKSGVSSFVNNQSLFTITNATNSYCELGEFSESCDQYQ